MATKVICQGCSKEGYTSDTYGGEPQGWYSVKYCRKGCKEDVENRKRK